MGQLPLPGKPNPTLTQWKAVLDPVIASMSSSTPAAQGYIGEVRAAFLTEAQFQNQAGMGWVLCDGRNVANSAYAALAKTNTIPDMRATVARMKDNGSGLDPAGDLALGTYEVDETAVNGISLTDPGHNHSQNAHSHAAIDPGHSHEVVDGGGGQVYQTGLGSGAWTIASAASDNTKPVHTSTQTTGITLTNTTGINNPATTGITISSSNGETRAKSTIVNYFIRIN